MRGICRSRTGQFYTPMKNFSGDSPAAGAERPDERNECMLCPTLKNNSNFIWKSLRIHIVDCVRSGNWRRGRGPDDQLLLDLHRDSNMGVTVMFFIFVSVRPWGCG